MVPAGSWGVPRSLKSGGDIAWLRLHLRHWWEGAGRGQLGHGAPVPLDLAACPLPYLSFPPCGEATFAHSNLQQLSNPDWTPVTEMSQLGGAHSRVWSTYSTVGETGTLRKMVTPLG